ncbi:helix-turn-helix transcriptional regulator [Salipiger marinus]|uniref:helix-turn-helix transcriptional regulator n=1 Tax=Salipiger marinus TaxID=555512 RepID=UPI004059071C
MSPTGSEDSGFRRQEFIQHLCLCAELPALLMGFYDSATRRISESWAAGTDGGPTPAEMIRAAEARLAVQTALTANGPPQEAPEIWLAAGPLAVGMGKPVARLVPVLVCTAPLPLTQPGLAALLRMGLAYAHQQLTEDVYSRLIWPEGLVEATLRVLSIEVFLVTATGEIRYDGRSPGPAGADDPDWLMVNGRLSLRDDACRAQLQRALAVATGPAPSASIVSVPARSGLMRMAVVAPLLASTPPQAMVLFEAPRTDHAALREHFFATHGLTQSEKLVAQEVLDGKTLNEAAENTRFSLSTVRSYMKQIFAKTGAHRQSELISMYYTAILPVGTSIASAEARRSH